MKNKINKLVEPIVDLGPRLSVTIAILKHNQKTIFCYGESSPQIGRTTPDTIFEIASLSKVFTTTLLAQMVDQGLVTLEQPVASLLPEFHDISTEITLLHLATHTAGLPIMPHNILWHTIRNPKNPFATYSYEDLFQFLKAYRTRLVPVPAPYNYSNVGYAILSYAIAKRLNQTFETAIETKVCSPLGLKDTTFRLTSEQQQRLACGFSSPMRPAPNWDVGALKGASGLLSSTQDLVHFIQAHLGFPEGLAEGVRTLCHTPQANMSPHSQIALGWIVNEINEGTTRICWKEGASAGYRAFLGFNQQKAFGVVVLMNLGLGMPGLKSTPLSAEEIGLRILAEAVTM